MSKSDSTPRQPKSIRQKRILEIAADNPGATLAEIADQIPSVSTDHVDRVLDQYGDPAASSDSDTDGSSSGSNADSDDDLNRHLQNSSDAQPPAEATTQPHDPPVANGEEPDDQSTTETAVATHTMDPETETQPTDPAVESESDPVAESPNDTAETTDSAAEPKPAADISETTGSDSDDTSATDETPPEPEDLTQKERETLRAIYYEPTATQNQVAEMLSISRATVSNRVNAIPGFDWADRDSFVEEVFDGRLTVDVSTGPNNPDDSAATQNVAKESVTDGASSALSNHANGDSFGQETSETPDGVVDGPVPSKSRSQGAEQTVTTNNSTTPPGDELEDISHQLEKFAEQLATVEEELQAAEETAEASALSNTDLLHKIVHACIDSGRITEEEELQILDALMD